MRMRTATTIVMLGIVGSLGVVAQERFDDVMRGFFFAGFAGDRDALAQGMRATEEILAADPSHAEARVWHGAGALFRAGEAFENRDADKGISLWQEGLAEMAQAVALAPTDVAVLIPRGATLITTSRFTPPAQARPILEIGVNDFEQVLELQTEYFTSLGSHARGELLTGLADGWSRLGNRERARAYFERIAVELADSVYARKARAWLEDRPEAQDPAFFNCSGCHVP